MKYYGVRRGRITGVFTNWEDCRAQIFQFPNAEYKSFPTKEAAALYVQTGETRFQASQPETAEVVPTAVEVWVDGACLKHETGSLGIGWGLLINKRGQEIYRNKGNDIPWEAFEHRNVAGEIWAILKALEWGQTHGISEMTIYFDYQGLESWVTGSWKTKLPFTQLYAQRVRDSGIRIYWKKVKAHSGIPENETVDQLAKEGAEMSKNRRGSSQEAST
ncbi:MAG: ribonuclease H family protein [Nitrospirales bacterium]|nr:ribonuclease H family protein [Nitrospirales bacterium]